MPSNQGWIKVYRDLLEKSVWIESTPEQKTVLITLLLMVNHEPNSWEWQGEKYTVQPGQIITSLDSIVQKAGKQISVQNVRTALKRFEKLGFLTNKSTNKNRLITIVKWGDYQSKPEPTNNQPNRQLTSSQQAANKRLTTNKNDIRMIKNDKEVEEGGISPKKIYDYYEQNGFGTISPKTVQDFGYWVQDFQEIGASESDAIAIVIHALGIAIDRNKRNYGYVNAILKNWEQSRFKTIEQITAEDTRKSKEQLQHSGSSEYDNLGW